VERGPRELSGRLLQASGNGRRRRMAVTPGNGGTEPGLQAGSLFSISYPSHEALHELYGLRR